MRRPRSPLRLLNPNRRAQRTVEVYQRGDGLWGWRLRASNGQVVATDGGQGYVDPVFTAQMAESVTGLTPVLPE